MNRAKCFSILAGALLLAVACPAEMVIQQLRCEYLANPLGIDSANPRLSWVLDANERGAKQAAYQILVASSAKLLEADKGDLWDSSKVISDETAQIDYAGQALVSRKECFWKVKVWDGEGRPSAWSPVAHWQMGLLEPADWTAQWIAPGIPEDSRGQLVIHRARYEGVGRGGAAEVTDLLTKMIRHNRLKLVVNNQTMGGDPADHVPKQLRIEYEYAGENLTNEVGENRPLELPGAAPVPYLRKCFELKSPVKRAMLYVTALGLYEAHINGHRVGNHVLAPDWTDYRKRVRYQAYDVTASLRQGSNAMGAVLANGWFSGHIGNGGYAFFGSEPEFLAQLEVTCADGHTERIVTDGTWQAHESAILSADFMQGENFDARREIKGWDRPGLNATAWSPVTVREEPARKLESQVMEPVREICELKPKSVKEPQPGHWVFDLGQNMVGVARLKIWDLPGTRITLRHAEMLNPDGTLYTNNLRGAPSVDTYVCKGGSYEVWQPRFTFHGFRYVEVSGLTARPGRGTVTGIVIGSDNRKAGSFACSDSRLNQLQSNIQWGQRGNYISVPTDCPQRDERLGWMGDAEVFIRTATYNADVASFFTKWLADVDDGQNAAGSFSDVSPDTMGVNGVPAWGDAGVICPWTVYEVYGDKRILERHLPAMTRWVDYLQAHSVNLIRDKDRGNDYGDWLSIGANTPKDLIGTAFFAHVTELVAKSYRVAGQTEAADKYERLFGDIKTAFNQRYVAADGRIQGNTQCAYAMALKFGLLPDELRPKAAQYLQEDIQAKGGHLSTGFVGVSYLLPVLTQAGMVDTAYELLRQDTFPSWLFSVKHGATTIWERWDGWTPEKGFQDPGMNSFNHYSLGSCGEYLFGGIGGIQPASPGYKSIVIRPAIHDGLTWARTRYESVHGTISTAWKRTGSQVTLTVEVPANTTATVCIPATAATKVTESGRSARQVAGVQWVRQEKDTADFEIGSGTYRFISKIN